MSTPVTVLIPLGGIGSRFQKEGYTKPKPLVSVLGEAMIVKVIKSLRIRSDDTLVVVYNPAFIYRSLWEPIKARFPMLQLVELKGPTAGAAETVMIGLNGLSKQLRERPVILADGDCFYDEDVVEMYRAICTQSNAVFYFRDIQAVTH